jgi:hypothetical protein
MDFKQVLIEKGEKLGLGIAGGVALLLVGLGAMTYMDSAFDPEKKKEELSRKTAEIQRKIADPNAKPDPLDASYSEKFEFDKVQALGLKAFFFDPFAQPDNKRYNPTVVKVKSIQADAISAKIPAYDIIESPKDIRIGVKIPRATGGKTKDVDLKSVLNPLQKQRFGRYGSGSTNQTPPATGPGGPGGMTGGPSGPGGPGGPGGRGSGTGSVDGGGFGSPGGMEGLGGGPGGFDTQGQRMDITYVRVDDEKGLAGKQLAMTLYTSRMVVVQAALPYREQLDQIRASMKISTMSEFLTRPESMPVFKGINVQRREIGPDGSEGNWIDLKFEESYRPIFMRKISDLEDDIDLNYVKLHPANRLVMPLPTILNTRYPGVKLPELTAEIEKRKALNAPPPAAAQDNKFKGQGDIFNPQGFDRRQGGGFGDLDGEGSLGGLGNTLGSGRGMGPGAMGGPMGPGLGGPGFGGPMGGPMGEGSGGNLMTNAKIDPLEYVLIRIVDADPFIQPGRKYQYRFQLKMENPNFGKPDLVSVKSDAEKQVLVGDWGDAGPTVTVPGENFIYSVEPMMPDPKDSKKMIPMPLKDGQAMLQIQRWQEQVRVDNYKEPFGDWLVVDTVVTRGARVGGRQLVNLPLWSSELNNFVLRELKDDKGANKGKDARKGVILNLTRTDLFVVDTEGGRQSYTNTRNKRIDDECTQEILLFSEETGAMRVLSSSVDQEVIDRKRREEEFKTWVTDVEKNTRKGPTSPDGKDDGSGRFGEKN